MSDNCVAVFGRIERIVDERYINGQLFETRFEMRVFSVDSSEWTDERRFLDFYGVIPDAYVGKEARHFSSTTDTDGLKKDKVQINVGKIAPRDGDGSNGIYEIVADDDFNPTVPNEIRSEHLKMIGGRRISPYSD